LTTKTSLAFQEYLGESYGRCKDSTTIRETKRKYHRHHHQQSSWTRRKCKQWSMRPSLKLSLKPVLQLWQLSLLLRQRPQLEPRR
jgi:hypothetical protein